MRSLSVTTIRRMSSPAAAKDVVDPTDVVGGDPDAARTPEDVAELLAGEADRRRVDDRQELLEVLDKEAIEQRLVAVLERGESDVPLQVIWLAPDVLQLQCDLLVDRGHARRQQAVQAVQIAFPRRERRPFVEERLRDQVVTATPDEATAGRSVSDGR